MVRKAAAVILLLAGVRTAWACAPAPQEGDRVAVVEESAVIVWEPATRTEHFIRRATFRGAARDFGFLVPTPTVPQLAEVGDAVFDILEARTRPETVYVTRRQVDWTPLVAALFVTGRGVETATTAANPVDVVSVQKVAGYEAAVLDATDAVELQRWLTENGYAASPDLVEWLDAYIRKRWKITAFKIDATQPESATRTSAVKMSFVTDQPFFPYREPASQRDMTESRSLRVWFVGPERVGGTIAGVAAWPAQLRRSQTLDDSFRSDLEVRANVSLPPGTRFTAFEDSSTPRPGTDDLFFARASDQSTVIPPPYVVETIDRTPVPLDMVALLGGVVIFFGWRSRRRKSPEY